MSSKRPSTLANGRYELADSVGSGGMATVYRAWDTALQSVCAIKLLVDSAARSLKLRRRFLSEAHTMAALDHPNVVRVLSVGHDDPHYYFVMELAEGGSIADLLRRHGARGPAEALTLMFQVLQGLDYAHTAGVVHRDIKPHNMLLQEEPELDAPGPRSLIDPRQTVKLTDFGIAKHMMVGPGARITGTGDTLGTLAYMAPEQRTDPRNALAQSDIYGVGATLYMMITGRRPFDIAIPGGRAAALERVPEPLRALVDTATAHDTSDRYGSAREMGQAVADAWGRVAPDARPSGDPMAEFDLHADTIVAPHLPEDLDLTWGARPIEDG